MKGFTHFISGIAVATCFEQAVHMALQDQSFILCLGGIFGILPDTLDFKFGKYFYKSDFEVKPDFPIPDPQKIAQIVANAIYKALTNGKSSIQLHTIQLAANLWQSYTLAFDKATQEVVVEIGPIVDTGQQPYITTAPKQNNIAKIKVDCNFIQEYDKKTNISIMSGPCFEFVKRDHNSVEVIFLPWHRTWSHSLTLGVILSLVVGIASYLMHYNPNLGPLQFSNSTNLSNDIIVLPKWMLFSLISFLGFLVHIVQDSTGFMGNSLLYPLIKERSKGWGIVSASEAIPNFFFVWTSLIIIIFNLDRFTASYTNSKCTISNYESFFFWFFAVPGFIMLFLYIKNKILESATNKIIEQNAIVTNKEPDFDNQTNLEKESDISTI